MAPEDVATIAWDVKKTSNKSGTMDPLFVDFPNISKQTSKICKHAEVSYLPVTNSLETKVKLELRLLFSMTLLDCYLSQVLLNL